MSPRPTIRSASNATVQRVRAAVAGREKGVVVLEGLRLVNDALNAGFALELALVAQDREQLAAELAAKGVAVHPIDNALLERISALSSSQGVIALGSAPRERRLEATHLGPEALVLVVAGIADPGNLGALARSAEAAGAQALAILAGSTSPWNVKALRGSMGSLLRLPVLVFPDAPGAADQLRQHDFRNVCAATRGGLPPSEFRWVGRIALWVGSEIGELPAVCASFEHVTIPIAAAVESLNVTVAASLLLFAAGRVGGGA